MSRTRTAAALFTVPLIAAACPRRRHRTRRGGAAPREAPHLPGRGRRRRGRGPRPDREGDRRAAEHRLEAPDRCGALAGLAEPRHEHGPPRPRALPPGFGVPLDDPDPAEPGDARHQPGHHLHRRAAEARPCIRWTGPTTGEGLHIDGVHVWTFTEVAGGVLVRTEETHTGEQVEGDVPFATEILRQGLEAWLGELKTAAEARSC